MWYVATFLLLGITQTHAENPALQAVLSQKGLTKVSQWATDWFQDNLSTITLQEIKGNVSILVGTIYYSLHDMTIVRCDLPEPSVSFSEGTGLSLQLQGLSIAIKGLWNANFLFLHTGGWFDMAVFTINLNTLLQFEKTEEHFSITTAMCHADVGSVQINFHGGSGFIARSFVKKFSGQIANLVQKQICSQFQKGIENIDKYLSANDVIRFDYVYLNLSLTDSPVVFDNGFELNVKGEFYSIKSPSEPPFSPQYFKLPWLADYMLSVGVSEFCINSAAYAYLKSGVLSINITDGMIPKGSPIHLNTSQFGILIPQLPKKYPDMEMEVVLYATNTPLISFNQTIINAELSATAKFSAVKSPSCLIPLFSVNMHYSFSAKVFTDGQQLKGFLEMKNLTVALGTTEIGKFDITPFEKLMKTVMNSFVLPKINAQLKDGLPLPSVKGFSLNKAVMTIENGFMVLAADLNRPF